MNDKSNDFNGFGYRVAGVMIRDEKVLLQTDPLIDFWTLPGGGVKPFESSEVAIKREFREEMNLEIRIERLLWIIENSFIFDGVKMHGIGLDFLIHPIEWSEKLLQDEFYGIEDDFSISGTRYENVKELKMTFRWIDLNKIDSINIKPKIYHKALKNIPQHPELLRNLEVKLK